MTGVQTCALPIFVVMVVAPRSQNVFAAQQKSLGLLNNQVEETYGGHVVVKSFKIGRASCRERV